jgi:hypothetical protein
VFGLAVLALAAVVASAEELCAEDATHHHCESDVPLVEQFLDSIHNDGSRASFCVFPYYCLSLPIGHDDPDLASTVRNATFLATLHRWQQPGICLEDGRAATSDREMVATLLDMQGCSSEDSRLSLRRHYDADVAFLAAESPALLNIYATLRRIECSPPLIRRWLHTMHSSAVDPGSYGIAFVRSFVRGFRSHPELAEALKRLSDEKNGGRLVVLGSSIGPEVFYARLALGVPLVLGVDLSCESVQTAQEVAQSALPPKLAQTIEFQCANALDIDYVSLDAQLVYVDDAGWDEGVVAQLAGVLDATLPAGAVVVSWSDGLFATSSASSSFSDWCASRRRLHIKASWQLDDDEEDEGLVVWSRTPCPPPPPRRRGG